MTNTITWANADKIIENAKETMGKEMFSSYDSLITHQNALVSWLGYQANILAEEYDTKEARLVSKACGSLWGDLYQREENEEEDAREETLKDFFVAFMKESDSPWLTMTFTIVMVRYALKGSIYWAGQSAEAGNTNALKGLAHFKGNLAAFEDIANSIADIADLGDD